MSGNWQDYGFFSPTWSPNQASYGFWGSVTLPPNTQYINEVIQIRERNIVWSSAFGWLIVPVTKMIDEVILIYEYNSVWSSAFGILQPPVVIINDNIKIIDETIVIIENLQGLVLNFIGVSINETLQIIETTSSKVSKIIGKLIPLSFITKK